MLPPLVLAYALTSIGSVEANGEANSEANALLQATRLRLPVAPDGEAEARPFDVFDDHDENTDDALAVDATDDASEVERGGSYGENRFGPLAAGTPLEYYRLWNQGWLSLKKDKNNGTDADAIAMTELQVLGSDEAATLFHSHQQNCKPLTTELKFLESSRDEDGVQHFLFQAGNKFQYLAFEGDELLHADPQVCPMNLLQEDGLESTSDDGDDDDIDDGEKNLALDDQLVSDCKKLMEHITQKECKRSMTFDISSATESVWDGIAVDTHVKVNGEFAHRIMCDFEVSPWSPDAELLQIQHVRGSDEKVRKESLNAVLLIEDSTPVCELDKKNGLSALELEELALSEQHSLGELSLSRGYEHLTLQGTEPMPASLLSLETPTSIDHRTAFSHCFLQKGAENMRNQGQCGSCWAFAAASATMADLCISKAGQDAMHSTSDRYEVSVAQIMSCNSARRGCNGGNAGSAGSAWGVGKGITKERDAKYMCGSGNPANHFDVPSTACKNPPWGKSCATNTKSVPSWNFAGVKSVRGEAGIRAWIGQGHSMYFRFDTHRNIFSFRGNAAKGVYNTHAGSARLGGHAVTLMGYGRLGSENYWMIQNSWGSGWGEGGYGRYKRGTNFGNCERYAYGFLAWVSGGTCPASQGPGMTKCTGNGDTFGKYGGGGPTGGPTNPPGTNPPGTNPPGTNPPGTKPPMPSGTYHMRKTGRCTAYVKTMAECGMAAQKLRLRDTSPSDDRQPNGVTYDPPYCYFEGGSLKFNKGRNTGGCTSWDQCLCQGPPGPTPPRTTYRPPVRPTAGPQPPSGAFQLKKSGSCSPTEHLRTAADCAMGAQALRLRDTSPSDDRQNGVSYDPPYCYFEGGSLKFNSNGRNRGGCTPYDQCLCRNGGAPNNGTTYRPPPHTTKRPMPPSGKYVKGRVGSTCPGTSRILSENDCMAASDQLQIDEFGFRRSEDEPVWPQGCYSLPGKGVYFNSNRSPSITSMPCGQCVPLCIR